MGAFTKITQDAFDELQTDAGLLLNSFTPATPGVPDDSDIICATTGGITVSCVPTYSDWGEDVDNCPNNMKEFKHLDGWDCKISTTAIGTSPALIKLALGAATNTIAEVYTLTADADIVPGKTYYTRSGTDPNYVYTPVASPVKSALGTYYEKSMTGKIVPNKDLAQADYTDLWWVGDKADGGFVAVKLLNALSTGGFSLKTEKNGKGQISIELTGHVSINTQTVMPMEFYSY